VLYEEAAAVPLIVVGDDIPAGHVVETPATLLDIYPFIIDCTGECDAETMPTDILGTSLGALIDGAEANRVAFSEYHGMGSKTGAFMVRKGPYKLIHYIDYPPQFFNLDDDPDEVNDLGQEVSVKPLIDEMMLELCAICDPDDVDRRAKVDQTIRLEESGGKEAVIARGDIGFSVPPGVKPMFD
jgi:choline-sulfatase